MSNAPVTEHGTLESNGVGYPRPLPPPAPLRVGVRAVLAADLTVTPAPQAPAADVQADTPAC